MGMRRTYSNPDPHGARSGRIKLLLNRKIRSQGTMKKKSARICIPGIVLIPKKMLSHSIRLIVDMQICPPHFAKF
jgi:hypothetical protein